MPQLTARRCSLVIACLLGVLITSCAVSPERQALLQAYEDSIPTCSNPLSCETRWLAARRWAIQHADFPIVSESEDRIRATSTLASNSGVGVVVHRQARTEGYAFLVDVECFSAYNCPDILELKLDFNEVVGAAGDP